jgi:hypothetical protein
MSLFYWQKSGARPLTNLAEDSSRKEVNYEKTQKDCACQSALATPAKAQGQT